MVDMAADIELDMVADMEVDMVADMLTVFKNEKKNMGKAQRLEKAIECAFNYSLIRVT